MNSQKSYIIMKTQKVTLYEHGKRRKRKLWVYNDIACVQSNLLHGFGLKVVERLARLLSVRLSRVLYPQWSIERTGTELILPEIVGVPSLEAHQLLENNSNNSINQPSSTHYGLRDHCSVSGQTTNQNHNGQLGLLSDF